MPVECSRKRDGLGLEAGETVVHQGERLSDDVVQLPADALPFLFLRGKEEPGKEALSKR